MIDPREITERYGSPVERSMRQWFAEHPHPVPAYPMAEYHLGWRDESLSFTKALQGKMLRPVLGLLSYRVFRDDFEKAVPLAAAIELYHNHTLVLDDIQDGDRLRRDRPAVWSLWGVGQGINVGILLGYLSQEFMLKLRHDFPAEKILALLDDMTETMLEVAEGQSLDLDFETRSQVKPEEYLNMIGKKTGALISLCTYGGAFLAQGDPGVARIFKEFGRKLGVAMQIRDDLVGIWGETAQSGKETAKDLRRRKKTFPIFKAFQLLNGRDLDFLKTYFSSEADSGEAAVEKILVAFEREGVRESCVQAADALMEEVFATLRDSGISREKLKELEGFSRHAFSSIGTLRQAANPTSPVSL